MKAGFYGGLVVDYPNSTKAKKFFLVLMTGGNMPLPKALGTSEASNGMNKFIAESKWNLGLFFYRSAIYVETRSDTGSKGKAAEEEPRVD